MDVTSGNLNEAQILAITDLRSNGDVYLTGAVSAGVSYVLTIEATDNPLDANQPTRLNLRYGKIYSSTCRNKKTKQKKKYML